MVSLRKRKIFLFDLLFVFVCLFPSLFVCLPAQGGLIGLHPHQLLRLLHREQEELENDATGDEMRWRVFIELINRKYMFVILDGWLLFLLIKFP